MSRPVPPMPPTQDRQPYDPEQYPGYVEGDRDWAAANPEAVEWLADNHAAIRAALEAHFPQPDRNRAGKEPCGECRIQPGETCDICGASHA